ncbi:ubiquitin carboxyl-terminal hydrolase 25-like isoform X2 [Mytilus californianus]|uniref:ubiquitin carboxyl-terminal hydrolase 25-like isoform X2 n=1 Tax=Mytilus californianus TaxID=6549 RepID=UPI00224502D9|nr:ubiquitin carboxyl-terminal hydrolase 25-like isoform X2 [Mytilus californianus]
MTVKQPPLPQPCHSQGRKQDELLTVCNQIKEITGIHDEKVIKRAIDACQDENGQFNVENVVAMLVAEDSQVTNSPPKKSAVNPLPPRTTAGDTLDAKGKPGTDSTATQSTETQSTSTNKSQGVIDLTTETNESDELQKAIAASLQDTQGILGGQVSKEEQDISRVLEQSLIESKAGTKRKRGDIWFVDPLNPHERKRQEECPVGLKNVGNTCWFSAVIQSLFNLRRFRHLVLNFKLPKDPAQQETRNVRFMCELRHLFALMVGSKRKYVDPSKAVDILKEAFAATAATGVGDSQQDVSEFQHKLLEWLEDAFKTTFRPPSPETGAGESDETKNPMVELFYGQYRAEGVNEGKGFSNDENFGQFPLQVNGFRDIHESLEAATAHGAIETVSRDTTQQSGQELWFTKLPPVLTYELSRFQFNQQLGRPEKIHNKIEFPQVIYMDRYMIGNKIETRQRREQVKKLREELSVLYSKLDKFNHYGSGSKKVPLQDVLSYALEFAESKPETQCLSLDVEMESPKPHSSMVTETSADVPMTSTSPPSSSPAKKIATPIKPHRTNVLISNPSPKHVEDSELKVLQECLRRWRTEVEQDVRGLQENINSLEKAINIMYGDEAMRKCPYHLHAVLVHEGQAASGHYWAYIWSLTKWLKFNDISVTDASWEDLVKESVGGFHNASAYCLMYVDKSKLEAEEESCDNDVLPDDLKEQVLEDNNKFDQEIDDWDKEQARKALGAGDGDCTITGETKPGPSTSSVATQTQVPSNKNFNQEVTLAVTHAFLSAAETYQAANTALGQEPIQFDGPAILTIVIESELQRLDQIVKQLHKLLPKDDQRLLHPVIYLKACHAPRDVIHKFMLEQFSLCTLLTQNDKCKRLLLSATAELKQRQKGLEKDDLMIMWHDRFHQFRKIVYFFVKGLLLYNDEKYDKALPYLVHTYTLNTALKNQVTVDAGCLSVSLLGFYRRQCLLHMNDMLTHQFESLEDITETMGIMNNYIVPCLPCLLQSGYTDDQSAAEEIREKWCSFLGQEIGGTCPLKDKKVEMLQDLLSKLFEPPGDTNVTRIPAVMHSELKTLYREFQRLMDIADESGYLEKALQSK